MKKQLLSSQTSNPTAPAPSPGADPVKVDVEAMKAEADREREKLLFGDDSPDPAKLDPDPAKPDPDPAKLDPAKPDPDPAKLDPAKPDPTKQDPGGDEEDDVPDFSKPDPEDKKEEPPPPSESLAQKRARENGQRLKEIEAQLEVERRSHQETKKKLETISSGREYTDSDALAHPDVNSKRQDALSDLRTFSSTQVFPEASGLINEKFSSYLGDFVRVAALPEEEARVEAKSLREKLHNDFIAAVGEEATDSDAREFVRDTLRHLHTQANRYSEISGLVADLKKRASEGRLAQSTRAYEEHETSLREQVKTALTVTDAIRESDPYSPAVVVSGRVNSDQKAMTRLERVQTEVMSALLGPKPFTQAEIDTIVAAGNDPSKMHNDRVTRWMTARKKLIPQLVQGLFLLQDHRIIAEKAAEADKADNERKALDAGSKGGKANPEPVKKEPEKIPTLNDLKNGGGFSSVEDLFKE